MKAEVVEETVNLVAELELHYLEVAEIGVDVTEVNVEEEAMSAKGAGRDIGGIHRSRWTR